MFTTDSIERDLKNIAIMFAVAEDRDRQPQSAPFKYTDYCKLPGSAPQQTCSRPTVKRSFVQVHVVQERKLFETALQIPQSFC